MPLQQTTPVFPGRRALSLLLAGSLLPAEALAQDDACVECHAKGSPGIVAGWHGDEHRSAGDVDRVRTVTAETCSPCHEQRFSEFARGKHALAWASMKAMPTTHWKPMELIDGMKGCGGCHKLGLKDEAEIERLKSAGSVFGHASCDACHTRHTFSVKEAREARE